MPDLIKGFNENEIAVLKHLVPQLIAYDDTYEANRKRRMESKSTKTIVQPWRKELDDLQQVLSQSFSLWTPAARSTGVRLYELLSDITKSVEYIRFNKINIKDAIDEENERPIHLAELISFNTMKGGDYISSMVYFGFIGERRRIEPKPVPASSAKKEMEVELASTPASSSLREGESRGMTTGSLSAVNQKIKDYYEESTEETLSAENKGTKKEIINFLKDYLRDASGKDLEEFFAIHRFLQNHPNKTAELKLTAQDQAIENIRSQYNEFVTLFSRKSAQDERQRLFVKLKANFSRYNQLLNRIHFHQGHLETVPTFTATADAYFSELKTESKTIPNMHIILRRLDVDALRHHDDRYRLSPIRLNVQLQACQKFSAMLPSHHPLVHEAAQLQRYLNLTHEMTRTYLKKAVSCFRDPDQQRITALREIQNAIIIAFSELNRKMLNSEFGRVEEKGVENISEALFAKFKKIKAGVQQHHRRYSFFSCITNSRLVKCMDHLLVQCGAVVPEQKEAKSVSPLKEPLLSGSR